MRASFNALGFQMPDLDAPIDCVGPAERGKESAPLARVAQHPKPREGPPGRVG